MQAHIPWCIATVNHFYRYRCEQISNNRHLSEFVQWSIEHWKISYKMHTAMMKIARPHSEFGTTKILSKINIFREFCASIACTYSMRVKNRIRKIFRGKYCNRNGFHFLTDIISINVGMKIFKILAICRIEEM